MKNSAWKHISLACALSSLLFSTSAYAANVSYDAKYNGHCYKIVDTGTTWGQARAACERQGGHLVTITSSQEQSVVASLLRNKGRKNNYWLGGLKSGSRWQWITGESFSYSHWSAGQPDNFQGRENCLSMYRNRNPYAYNNLGEWNDAAPDGVCNNEPFFGAANFGYICEWDSDPNTNTNSVDGRLKGDVNGDGKVDKSDVDILDQYIVGIRSSLPCPRNADMNGDGKHTLTDVSQLARLLPPDPVDNSADGKLKGDVNGDGKVDKNDAEMLRQYIDGTRSSIPCPKNADANGNGEITVADFVKIVNIYNPVPQKKEGWVNTQSQNLNMRAGAGTSYQIVAKLAKGTKVMVYEPFNSAWLKVDAAGKTGYVLGQYITFDSPPPPPVLDGIHLSVPYFMQSDARWKNVKIKTKTIGQVGCLLTTLSMKYSYQTGSTIYPNAMKNKLSFSGNDVQWNSVRNLGYIYNQQYGTSLSNNMMQAIYHQLKANKPVIIGGTGTAGQHWVVITGYTGQSTNSFRSSDFTINDPNHSTYKTLDKFISGHRNIKGIVY